MKADRNTRFAWLFFPIMAWINGCQNVDNSKSLNYFFYNEDQSISTLDPAFVRSQSEIWAVSQIFEGLVEYDDTLGIQPCLAKKWELNEDGRVWTFHLRTDVFFQPAGVFSKGSRKMHAGDVVYSFRRIADPVTASPGAWIFNDKLDLSCFSDSSIRFPVEALDDSTVRISLIRPFAPFAGILAMPYCFIVPEEAVDREFRNRPVGTGPFQLKKWQEEVNLLFARNPVYYRFREGKRLPYLDGILVDNIRNKQTAFMKFIQGEYDFFNGVDASIKDELLDRKGNLKEKYGNRFHMARSPFLNTEYIGFHIGEEFGNHPLSNLWLRKALNAVLDRQKLITYLRNGVGQPAKYGFVPEGLPAYPYDKLPVTQYQPDSARIFLQRSGLKISEMKPIVLHTTQDYLELMVFVQKEWKQLGIPVDIEVHPSGFLRQLRKDGKINCWRGSWIADYPDAENYLICFETRNFSPSGPNYFHYSSPEYDSLLSASNRVADNASRMDLLARAERLMKEQVPCVVLYYDESIRLSQLNISGLKPNPINFLRLREVSKRL